MDLGYSDIENFVRAVFGGKGVALDARRSNMFVRKLIEHERAVAMSSAGDNTRTPSCTLRLSDGRLCKFVDTTDAMAAAVLALNEVRKEIKSGQRSARAPPPLMVDYLGFPFYNAVAARFQIFARFIGLSPNVESPLSDVYLEACANELRSVPPSSGVLHRLYSYPATDSEVRYWLDSTANVDVPPKDDLARKWHTRPSSTLILTRAQWMFAAIYGYAKAELMKARGEEHQSTSLEHAVSAAETLLAFVNGFIPIRVCGNIARSEALSSRALDALTEIARSIRRTLVYAPAFSSSSSSSSSSSRAIEGNSLALMRYFNDWGHLVGHDVISARITLRALSSNISVPDGIQMLRDAGLPYLAERLAKLNGMAFYEMKCDDKDAIMTVNEYISIARACGWDPNDVIPIPRGTPICRDSMVVALNWRSWVQIMAWVLKTSSGADYPQWHALARLVECVTEDSPVSDVAIIGRAARQVLSVWVFGDARTTTTTAASDDITDSLPCVFPVILRRIQNEDDSVLLHTLIACMWPAGTFEVYAHIAGAVRTLLQKYSNLELPNLRDWALENSTTPPRGAISGLPLVELILMAADYTLADEEACALLRGLVSPYSITRVLRPRECVPPGLGLFYAFLWRLDPHANSLALYRTGASSVDTFKMPHLLESHEMFPVVPGSGLDAFLLCHANELFPLNRTLKQNSGRMSASEDFQTYESYSRFLVSELLGKDILTPDRICVAMSFLPVGSGETESREFTQY